VCEPTTAAADPIWSEEADTEWVVMNDTALQSFNGDAK
jgi:hypothetical protein